jgi:hypothetical protein
LRLRERLQRRPLGIIEHPVAHAEVDEVTLVALQDRGAQRAFEETRKEACAVRRRGRVVKVSLRPLKRPVQVIPSAGAVLLPPPTLCLSTSGNAQARSRSEGATPEAGWSCALMRRH